MRLTQWLKSKIERSRTARLENKAEALRQSANRDVQVREFDGKLFVCYLDTPIIEQSLLECPIENAVGQARIAYFKYFKDREGI